MFGLESKEVNAAAKAATRTRPTVFDLRSCETAARLYECKQSEIQLNRNHQAIAEREAKAIKNEIDATEKVQETLNEPAIDRKLVSLRSELQERVETADRQKRIGDNRESVLEAWLDEGTPSNRALIERAKRFRKL